MATMSDKELLQYISSNPDLILSSIRELLAQVCPNECSSCEWEYLCDTKGGE